MQYPEVVPADIYAGVNFQPEFDPTTTEYNSKLGFLGIQEGMLAFGAIHLLSFGAPLARAPRGGYDTRTTILPLTEFHQLAEVHKTIDLQGKGVGPRLYNTPQAVMGLATVPDLIGAYVFSINPQEILDIRETSGNSGLRIARHAGRVLASKLSSVEHVVNQIHASYGDASAVLLKQPPLPASRQKHRGAANPSHVPAEFMIIRNPGIELRKVGTFRLDS